MSVRTPEPLDAVLFDRFGEAGGLRSAAHLHATLVTNCGGTQPPAAVQLVWQLLHRLPEEVACRPGSAAWRRETRRLLSLLPVYAIPTRPETLQALRFLKQRGLLPAWVRMDVTRADAR